MCLVRNQEYNQATQLRLAFAPSPPDSLRIDVSGLMLLVEGDRPDSELFTYLKEQGLQPDFRPGLGVSIPARFLSRLVNLSINVAASATLEPLWLLVRHAPPPNMPATVESSVHGYTISWEASDGRAFDEHIGVELARLLGIIDAPIVATDDVWQAIERDLPILGPSGSAALSPEGFVKISTLKPQVLEASTLSGLFRLSPTSFGMCLAYADELADEPGLRWVTSRPSRKVPAVQVPPHLALAPHIKAALPRIVADLATLGSKAVVWESGLGRRVLVLAALEILDAYPATVVCAPQAIWLWRRHAEMVGRTCGLLHEHNDIHIVTYHDLASRRLEPQALVFDGLNSDEADAAWEALERMQRYTDAYKIAVEDEWPEDPEESRRLLRIVRPAEFATPLSLAERYPGDSVRRLQEHAEAYLDRRAKVDTTDLRVFRQSSVRTVELHQAQQVAIAAAAGRAASRPPAELFAEILEIISAGPATTLSPKVAAAVELARTAHREGQRIVLATRHHRTAQLLLGMLRSEGAKPYDPDTYEAALVSVLRFEDDLPNLSAFAQVVLLDYPWSFTTLERAVLPAASSEGPDVLILHAVGSVDDRLAVFAARRAEVVSVVSPHAPPSALEIVQLLTPRW